MRVLPTAVLVRSESIVDMNGLQKRYARVRAPWEGALRYARIGGCMIVPVAMLP